MFPSSKFFRGAPLSGSSIKTPSTRFLKKPLKAISKTEFYRKITGDKQRKFYVCSDKEGGKTRLMRVA